MNDEINISIILEFVAIGVLKQFIDDSIESYFPPKQLDNIYIEPMHNLNPLTAKLFNLNFHPLEVVSR